MRGGNTQSEMQSSEVFVPFAILNQFSNGKIPRTLDTSRRNDLVGDDE